MKMKIIYIKKKQEIDKILGNKKHEFNLSSDFIILFPKNLEELSNLNEKAFFSKKNNELGKNILLTNNYFNDL